MNEFLHSFHQKVAKEFISELRLKSSESNLVHNQFESLNQRLDKLEELVNKADYFETNGCEEYPRILQELVIEKTKCFLLFDDLTHKNRIWEK
jgi:hypothetical protein